MGVVGEKSSVAILGEGDQFQAEVVFTGMSCKLSVPSLRLRPLYLRRLFEERFVLFLSSKDTVAQILSK